MKKQALPSPNRWATEQWWRYPFPNDERQANELRRALRVLELYPRRDLAENPRLAGWEANCRAALPDMLAELDRTEVIALTNLVRLLAVVPRPPGFFKRWGRRAAKANS